MTTRKVRSAKPNRPKATRRPSDGSLDKVRIAIRKVRPRLPARAITPEASLVDDLGVDSLALAELSIALEDVFQRPVFLGDVLAGIESPASITVGQLADYMKQGG